MGSTGSGSFGDYVPEEKNRCGKTVQFDLEDVARNPYWETKKRVPTTGDPVNLRAQPVNGRLVIEDAASGLPLGLVPVRFNYLLLCLGKNYKYQGTIVSSGHRPVPNVGIELAPA